MRNIIFIIVAIVLILSVDLFAENKTQEAISYLKKKGVDIHYNDATQEYTIDFDVNANDSMFQYISYLPNNKIVSIRGKSKYLTDAGLKYIKSFKKLGTLLIEAERISDAGLVNLKDLKNLEIVTLSSPNITSNGMEYIKDNYNISELSLTNTKIGDRGLVFLKDLKELTMLSLHGTNVTDAGIKYLINFEYLEYLRISKTKITDDGRKRLEKLLPNCNIWYK